MKRTEQYTEYVDGKPIDVEVFTDGANTRTDVNIRGKVWTFEQHETAASAYDKISAVNSILQRHGLKKHF